MELNFLEAAVADDRPAMKSTVDELIERYESDEGGKSVGRVLRDFLPLLPALAAPGDPAHRKALEYFGRDSHWTLSRWIWSEKFKLSKDDTITFLGGRETDSLRRILISYLDADKEANACLSEAYLQETQEYHGNTVLVRFLANKLAKTRTIEGPDLQPESVISTRTAVLRRLEAKH